MLHVYVGIFSFLIERERQKKMSICVYECELQLGLLSSSYSCSKTVQFQRKLEQFLISDFHCYFY